jgi:hypothetical protein
VKVLFTLSVLAPLLVSHGILCQAAAADGRPESGEFEFGLDEWKRTTWILRRHVGQACWAWAYYIDTGCYPFEGTRYSRYWGWMGFGIGPDSTTVWVTDADLEGLTAARPFAVQAGNTWGTRERVADPSLTEDGGFPQAALEPLTISVLSLNDESPAEAGYPTIDPYQPDQLPSGFYCVATEHRLFLLSCSVKTGKYPWLSRNKGAVVLLHDCRQRGTIVLNMEQLDSRYWTGVLSDSGEAFQAGIAESSAELAMPGEVILEGVARLSGVLRRSFHGGDVDIGDGWSVRGARSEGSAVAVLGKATFPIPQGRLRIMRRSSGAEVGPFDRDSFLIGQLGHYVIVVDSVNDCVYQIDART